MNLKTRIRSAAMRRFASFGYLEKQRAKARKQRKKQGLAPAVLYFHQVDDPYSHLAVQKLAELKARYDLAFKPFLVSGPEAAYQGDPERFDQWAERDAAAVAADYGVAFSPSQARPSESNVAAANNALAAHLNDDDFPRIAIEIGQALWTGATIPNSTSSALSALNEGNDWRNALGHYQGGMFYFDGEWFWGIDRIRLLEARLSDEGYDKTPGTLCVPEPTPLYASPSDTGHIVLEYFPSLRSPYTAIGHPRVLDLVHRTGVTLKVRPVMPMMMRGVPAPREKQRYIISDAGREGRSHGKPLGRIVDPFGEPVKRAFAWFPAAQDQGLAMEFITAYLEAAWFNGVDITNERGMKNVLADTGIEPTVPATTIEDDRWQQILEENLDQLRAENLWGVPSFRVTGGNSETPFACWGQDRIWRVANEIARRV